MAAKGEQPFLHMTHNLDPIYMYTIIISQRLRVIERSSFPYKVHSRGITQKTSKVEQPFLHVAHGLDLIYMPTKYYQNISKGII